jgi:hypothetical protein
LFYFHVAVGLWAFYRPINQVALNVDGNTFFEKDGSTYSNYGRAFYEILLEDKKYRRWKK